MGYKSIKRICSGTLAALMLLAPLPTPAQAAEVEPGGAEFDGYIVKLANTPQLFSLRGEARDLSQAVDGVGSMGMDGYYLADTLEAAEELSRLAKVEYIEPNYVRYLYDSDLPGLSDPLSLMANDTGTDYNATHLATIKVDKVWQLGYTGQDVDLLNDMGEDGEPVDRIVIAVIDTGLYPDHEDIDYSHVLPGMRFFKTDASADIQTDNNTADENWHGTFVTGEILARVDNIGINGIAAGAYVMPLRVFDPDSKGESVSSDDIVIKAIQYATEQKQLFETTHGESGANICVINMSLGGENPSRSLKTAVDTAIAAGIIVICAAGNDGNEKASYPAQYAIGVGATDADGQITKNTSYYTQMLDPSNGDGYRNKVWVASPGSLYTSLGSAKKDDYPCASGTSFACPQVAAMAAIALSLNNDLTSYYSGLDATVDDGSGKEIAVNNNHLAFKKLLKETSNLTDYNSEQTSEYNTGTLAFDGQDIRYGWGVVDFEKAAALLTTCSLSFTVKNADGEELTAADDLAVAVYDFEEDGSYGSATPLTPTDGVYSLTRGETYRYIITADRYKPCEAELQVKDYSNTLNITLEGLDYTVNFAVTDEEGGAIPNAVVQVYSGDTQLEDTEGAFLLKNGVYSYTVAAVGYESVTDSFTIDDSKNEYENDALTIPVEMKLIPTSGDVSFTVTGSDSEPVTDARITITDAAPDSDGNYRLGAGEYSYTVEAANYKTVSGSFSIEEGDLGTEKVIAVLLPRLYQLTIQASPEDAGIVLKNAAGDTIEPDEDGTYLVVSGTYTCTVTAEGFETASESVSVPDAQSLTVTLTESAKPDPGNEGGDDSDHNSGNSSGNTSSGGTSSGGTNSGSTSSGGTGSGSASSGGTSSGGTSSGGASSGGASSAEGSASSDTAAKDDPSEEIIETDVTEDSEPEEGEEPVSTLSLATVHPFDDVAEKDWFYDAVYYTVSEGLFSGTSKTSSTFSPNSNMTRSMLVTVLYRLDGEPEISSDPVFYDISAGTWYTDAVAWAVGNGVVNGYEDGSFRPESDITREQIAVMIYNYAVRKGYDVTEAVDLSAYEDAQEVSLWARSAMAWANAAGLITGRSQTALAPSGAATRAEVAMILMRFCEKIVPAAEEPPL